MNGPGDYRNVFGYPDAGRATDDAILADHLDQDAESHLKINDRPNGRSIVVGIKGCGKTDLRRYIETSDQAKALVLNLNCDTGYFSLDTTKISMKSGRIKNALALQLLGVFSEVIPNSGTRAENAKKALKRAAGSALQVGKQLGLAVELDFKFAQVDLSKLAGSEHTGFVKDQWDQMRHEVTSGLASSNERGYILIDDVEDVFPGIEANADFLEGLARAVVEMNDALGNRLHVLLFVKYGIWRYWFDHQREYDKVSSDIQMISWDSQALVDLIAKRIAGRFGLEPDSPAQNSGRPCLNSRILMSSQRDSRTCASTDLGT